MILDSALQASSRALAVEYGGICYYTMPSLSSTLSEMIASPFSIYPSEFNIGLFSASMNGCKSVYSSEMAVATIPNSNPMMPPSIAVSIYLLSPDHLPMGECRYVTQR